MSRNLLKLQNVFKKKKKNTVKKILNYCTFSMFSNKQFYIQDESTVRQKKDGLQQMQAVYLIKTSATANTIPLSICSKVKNILDILLMATHSSSASSFFHSLLVYGSVNLV